MGAGRIQQKTTPAPAPAPAPAPKPAATTTTAQTGFDTADQFQPAVSAPVALTTPAPVNKLTAAMTPAQSQAFAQLSTADQQTLKDFTQTWAQPLWRAGGRAFFDEGDGMGPIRDAILSGQGATIANLARGAIASDQKSGGQRAQQDLVNVLGRNGGAMLTKADPATGKTLLQELSALNGGGATALGYDRSQLAANIITDLSWTGMSQAAGAQDCGALAIAASLNRNPAAYAGMMIDLANGDQVTLPSGQSGQLQAAPFDPQSNKSMTNQLIDAAMSIPMQSDMSAGVTGEQVKAALQSVYGGSWAAMYTPDATEERSAAPRQEAQKMAATIMDEQLKKGQPLFANYDGHWVRVTYLGPLNGPDIQVEAMAQNGKGAMQVPIQQFLDGLDGLVFQSNLTMPPEWMQNAAWADPGGGSPHGTQGSDDMR